MWIRRFVFVAALTLFALAYGATHGHASGLQADERVILFPTNAKLEQGAQHWRVPVHGWVFEPEADSLWRNALLESLVYSLGLSEEESKSRRLQRRLGMFLVDNERGKALSIKAGPLTQGMQASGANGHFFGEIQVPVGLLPSNPHDGWFKLQLVTPAQHGRDYSGRAQRIAPRGLSVISDIDDTLKLSNVLDTSQLVRNTFLRPFVAIEGMSEAYRRWAAAGARFHYVSSSPWQLYPALSSFMQQAGFPAGSFHLKYFRPKDQSFFNLFDSPMESKWPVIEALLRRYPQRRFVLVGDSGEQDARVYARALAEHGEQIVHVFIRNVGNLKHPAQAYDRFYPGALRERLTVFEDPQSLRAVRMPGKARQPGHK